MKTIVAFIIVALFTGTMAASGQEQAKPGEKPVHSFAVKELKAFHDILHPLVHDALPKSDFGRIKKGLDKLLQKAIAIQKAKLPKELAGRKEEFKNTSNNLVTQLQDMVAMKDKVDDETLEKTFNEMHDTFEQLAEITR